MTADLSCSGLFHISSLVPLGERISRCVSLVNVSSNHFKSEQFDYIKWLIKQPILMQQE